MTNLADGTPVPDDAVAALDELEKTWPGATLPQARPAIVAAVTNVLKERIWEDGYAEGLKICKHGRPY